MAEVKNKTVTVESLAALHEHNKATYMNKVDPVGSGTMTFDGDIVTNSLMIGSNIKLVPTEDSLEIVFLNNETTGEIT